MKRYVCGIMFHDTDVVLIKKNKPEWQKGHFNFPGGHIEEGETPLQAVCREFEEETGHASAESDWTHRVQLVGPDYIVHFFSARVLEKFPLIQADEQCHWNQCLDLPYNTLWNLWWLIPLVLDVTMQFPITLPRTWRPPDDSSTVDHRLAKS